ncbi:O-antigen ligase family protein [Halomonas sp. SH5A2]|uniref:O-antigen ligase family protein n=1 Tax=Halomonas sp. SH5A2 TaxID=2749040 RepID=UPI001640C22C|nr:O-antigen ligase family protein [Halomonas sp. SH5A2]QNI02375.1 O-antigen ligase family protein [Halomonas sp. SH5A2]
MIHRAYVTFAIALVIISPALITDSSVVNLRHFIVIAFMSFAVFLFLVYIYLAGYVRLNVFYVFFLFSLFILISYFSASVGYGYHKIIIGCMVPFVFALAVVSSCRLKEKDIILSFVYLSILSLVVGVVDKAGQDFFVRGVRFGFFGAITMSWMMSIACLISLYLFFREGKRYYIFLGVIFLLAVLWTQSRGGGVALLVSSFILILLSQEKRNVRRLLLYMLFCSMLVVLYLFTEGYGSIGGRLINTVEGIVHGTKDLSEIFGIRYYFYKISFESISLKPFFGVGVGEWSELNKATDHFYPHNVFLEVASESGLLNFTLFIFMLLIIFIDVRVIGKVLMIYGLLSLSFSGDISYLRYFILLPLMLFFIKGGRFIKCKEEEV